MSGQPEPYDVDDRRHAHDDERLAPCPPPVAEHDRRSTYRDHGDPDPGTHEADNECGPNQRHLATPFHTVVIDQDEGNISEQDRPDEADLERPQQILVASAEHQEHRHEDRRNPGVDPDPHHEAPDKMCQQEMGNDEDSNIRKVRSDSEYGEKSPVLQNRQRRPMLIVRSPKPRHRVGQTAVGNKVPVIAKKPLVPVKVCQHEQRSCHGGQVGHQGRPAVTPPGTVIGRSHRRLAVGFAPPGSCGLRADRVTGSA